jgi:hypothetical protein
MSVIADITLAIPPAGLHARRRAHLNARGRTSS